MECLFCPDIREIQQYDTLGNIWPVRPPQVNDFLKKNQGCVWYQDNIFMDEHRMVGPFQFGTVGRKILKYPNTIEEKQWKALGK